MEFLTVPFVRRDVAGAFIASFSQKVVGIDTQIMIVGEGKLQSVTAHFLSGHKVDLLNEIRLPIRHWTMAASALGAGTFPS